MAENDIAIINNALLRIGQNSITSLTPPLTSDAQRLAQRFYTPTLRRLLRAHNWNFATFRQALAALTDSPVNLGDRAPNATYFTVPTDPECLMVLETNLDDQEPWRLETIDNGSTARVFVTDASAVSILYIGLVTDTTLFDDLFTYLFECDLSYQFAYALTRNAQLSASLKQELNEARQMAKSRDGQESRMLRKFNSEDLTKIR